MNHTLAPVATVILPAYTFATNPRKPAQTLAFAHKTCRKFGLDGWAIRLASTFPKRSELDPVAVESASPNYPTIRVAATHLLAGGHIQDVLGASYAKIIVDEYQDCAIPQHKMICHAAETLPAVLLGDHYRRTSTGAATNRRTGMETFAGAFQ